MSRRSSSTPNFYSKDALKKIEKKEQQKEQQQARRGSGAAAAMPKIRAPRMFSFAAANERQFSYRHTQNMENEFRSVPGKGLARRHTKFVEKDELDEEVHVASTTAMLPAFSPQHQTHKHPSALPPSGKTDDTIRLARSGSMTQYDAMYDAIKALESLDKEEDDEGQENEDVKKGVEDQQIKQQREEEKDGGDGQQVRQPEQSPVVLERKTSTVVVFQEDVSSSDLRDQSAASKESSSNIRIKPAAIGSGGMISLDSNTINFCREQSTVRIGNTVLFPLVLVKQPDIWRRFDLECADFKTWKHFTDGSNSHIYKAKCAASAASSSPSTSHSGGENAVHALQPGMKVIIKALKDSELQNSIALKEFDSERELLASISHDNILKFLGSGVDLCDSLKKANNESQQGASSSNSGERGVHRGNSMQSMLQGRGKIYPRPFLVLERLNGGSLALLLSQHQQSGTRLSPLRALQICQQLAQALDYLHNHFHAEAVLIHRDIKPDNIGFDDRGILKLMDFGISTCIRREVLTAAPYLMTGLTGSLRYMAKEVFLEQPYNQKVDVHSVGILMWHIVTCSMPYPRFSRKQFTEQVVGQDLRPPLEAVAAAVGRRGPAAGAQQQGDNGSPQELHLPRESVEGLMERCWSPDFRARPDISEVLASLNALLEEETCLHIASGGCCGS